MQPSNTRRARCTSKWKNIIVFGKNGEEIKEFGLDNYGNLLQKLPPKKRRKFKDNDDKSTNNQDVGDAQNIIQVQDQDIPFEDHDFSFQDSEHITIQDIEDIEDNEEKKIEESPGNQEQEQDNQSMLNLRFKTSKRSTENALEFQETVEPDQDDATSEAYITETQGVFYD